MENNFDIFNLDNDAFIKQKPSKLEDENIYKPYPELGKDGVYKSLIRFLPNVYNTKKSKIQLYYVWLKDPADGSAFVAHCPTSVGKKSPLKDMYWKLKNSPSAKDQELSKAFSRKEDFYSLIQILKDPNRPDLEGKIMIFKFGKKVNDMIEQQIKPEFGTSCNPYNLFEGKNFGLHVRKVGDWNNYDLCQFVGNSEGARVDGVAVKETDEGMAAIREYLKAGPKNLSDYDYKEWSDSDRETINRITRSIVPDGRLVSEIMGATTSNDTGSLTTSNRDTRPAEDENLGSDPQEPFERVTPKSQTVTPKKPTKTASSLDDIYADL